MLIGVAAAFAQRVAVKVIPVRFRQRLQLFPSGSERARDRPGEHGDAAPEPEVVLKGLELRLDGDCAGGVADVADPLSPIPAKSKFVVRPIAPVVLRNESLNRDRCEVFTVQPQARQNREIAQGTIVMELVGGVCHRMFAFPMPNQEISFRAVNP